MHNAIKRFNKKTIKTGLPPGTLVANKSSASPKKTIIRIFEYNDQVFTEREVNKIEDCLEAIENKATVKWIDVDGIHNTEIIEGIGRFFNIHPLTLEDIVSNDQRPKYEDYEQYVLCIFRMLGYQNCIISEQLSIVLRDNVVITFQEHNSLDAFDVIRERLRTGKGRVRKTGSDYLAYALIDAVVDTYFVILEKLGDKIEAIEENLTSHASKEVLDEIYALKREMIYLRKSVWPLREMINTLQKSDSDLFTETTHIYIRDVYDHTVRVIETVETYRDLLSGMMDVYHSMQNNKMNEIMKMLTIISSVFIPITFIVGVYGMNFEYMPELKSKIAYPFVWLIMIGTVAGMLYYFKKKKWL